MVEQEAVNFEVAGSSPVPGAIFVSQKHQKNGLGLRAKALSASPVPGAIFVSQKHQKNGLGLRAKALSASPVLVFFL